MPRFSKVIALAVFGSANADLATRFTSDMNGIATPYTGNQLMYFIKNYMTAVLNSGSSCTAPSTLTVGGSQTTPTFGPNAETPFEYNFAALMLAGNTLTTSAHFNADIAALGNALLLQDISGPSGNGCGAISTAAIVNANGVFKSTLGATGAATVSGDVASNWAKFMISSTASNTNLVPTGTALTALKLSSLLPVGVNLASLSGSTYIYADINTLLGKMIAGSTPASTDPLWTNAKAIITDSTFTNPATSTEADSMVATFHALSTNNYQRALGSALAHFEVTTLMKKIAVLQIKTAPTDAGMRTALTTADTTMSATRALVLQNLINTIGTNLQSGTASVADHGKAACYWLMAKSVL